MTHDFTLVTYKLLSELSHIVWLACRALKEMLTKYQQSPLWADMLEDMGGRQQHYDSCGHATDPRDIFSTLQLFQSMPVPFLDGYVLCDSLAKFNWAIHWRAFKKARSSLKARDTLGNCPSFR